MASFKYSFSVLFFMAKRVAIVKKDKINAGDDWQRLAINACPVNRSGTECITMGEDGKIQIDEATCIGCGICVKKCPNDEIIIVNLPEALEQEPIHCYGKNAFRLFSLPTPVFGKVVGILGVNGIGKSTAIKILAGVLKPNLGNLEGEASYDDLIEHFKGTEAQKFFEKVRSGDIIVSYKPQQVDQIPNTTKGKVRDLLKKVDERKKFDEVVEELQIGKILDNDIREISGGELQRVAIAATVLKKANFYVFDEPTSYLDIKQRIRVSKFIRSLADENTAVMVVEHDLIILDYMADLINILYGKQSAYGIVSQPKSTKVGINIFLEGYLKEENVRFRDYQIRFMKAAPIKESKRNELTSWSSLSKKLGKFSLEAEQGTIEKHSVFGVLGENGIGKTTFAKILAGVEKPDSGEIGPEVKVSYKAQYLEANDELVANVLKDAVKNFNTQIVKPLGLTSLMTLKLSELSGGELQRVAIASCLSKEADLYLLDEPSAYLDVEQRLLISKIIKDFMEKSGKSALIIDHDLLFIDYISSSLLVFDGEPAVKGIVKGPYSMEEGMNVFLKDLGITFRRDPESNRPRANKPDSQMDRQQKSKNVFYYS